MNGQFFIEMSKRISEKELRYQTLIKEELRLKDKLMKEKEKQFKLRNKIKKMKMDVNRIKIKLHLVKQSNKTILSEGKAPEMNTES